MKKKTVILGLGNILMGDEGIGVRAVEYMQEKRWSDNVSLLDGGTGGFHLLPLFGEHDRIVMIDATIGGKVPGEIKVLKPRFASDFPRSLTSHDIGLRDLIQSAELIGRLPEITLVTINIGRCNSVEIGISPELIQKLPEIHQTVQTLLLDQ
ncbi:MAG: hydrogenase maturation protease [Bacteroidota bacterium]